MKKIINWGPAIKLKPVIKKIKKYNNNKIKFKEK